MKKAVLNVMFITVLAKLLGFARELLLSYFFGASGVTDAYLISQTIPGIIFQFVGTGLATCFIPIYLDIFNQEGEKKANYFTNTILTIIFIFSTVIVALVWVDTPLVVKIFASGFTGETLELGVLFTKIGIFSLYFSSVIYILNSFLQLKNAFTFVAFTAIPNSIMIMLSIILGNKVGIIWLPIGSILAVMLQAVFLVFASYHNGFKLKLNLNLTNPKILEMIKLLGPVTIGVSISELNVLIDRTVASGLAVGGVSALNYAESLIMFVQGIFVQTIATVYYPKLTELVGSGKMKETKAVLNEAMEGMFYLLAPITIGCALLSKDVVCILYGRGNFSSEAVSMTSEALMLYTIGIIGYGFREIFSRVFYAFHDTKTPMVNAAIGVVVNIVMNLTLSPIIGIGGLALATSISSIITAVLLYIQLRKKMPGLINIGESSHYIKIVISVVVMGIAVYFCHMLIRVKTNIYISFVVAVLCGIFVYLIGTIILKVNIITDIISMVKKKHKK